jgi:carbon-monoxide dehydrogenase small subunit
MPKKIHVQATINGKPTDFLCEPRQSLLEVLRDELRLTGSKEGCNNGNCGACNVILEGRLVNSCLVLAAEVQGQSLTTIEGVAPASGLHPLQQQFLEHAALQCGICTPGFIIAAKALLEANPNPSEDQVRHWLAGNLCRCTGYDKIIRAVLGAAGTQARSASEGSSLPCGS